MRHALVAIALLGLAVSCKKNNDPTSVDYWAEQAKSPSKREEALRELGKLGKKEAAPILLQWLQQEGPWQGDAAYSLAQLGDPNIVPELAAKLDTGAGSQQGQANAERVYINLSIVRALALLHSPAAIPALLKLLDNPEVKTREAVINTLGALRARQAVPQLAAQLKPEVTPLVAQATVRALGNIGGAESVPPLLKCLYDDALYEEARFSLVQVGAVAIEPLVKTLARQNPDVEALRLADGKPLPVGIVEARAAAALGAMRAHAAEANVATAFDKLFKPYEKKPKDTPGSTFSAIIELAYALGNLGGQTAIKTLLPLVKSSQGMLQVAAAEALTAAGPDPASIQALLAAAQSSPLDVREALVSALSRLGDGQTLAALQAYAHKKGPDASLMIELMEDAEVRLNAAKECGQQGPCWRQKLQDRDAAVRDRAAYEIGWLQVKEALPDLLKAAEDDAAEVRMAAVLSMQRLGGVDTPALQKIYDAWANKMQYAAVNQELKCLIARSKSNKS